MERAKARQILRIALPLILQQLCMQMQLWIDRAMLGHVDAAFFSALGNATIPYHMVISAITAVCGGTAILTAQGIGSGNLDKVRDAAEASFLGSGLISTAAFGFFLFCSGALFRLMGVQSPILEYATDYIRILSFSMLLLGPSATATAILQGFGYTGMIMTAGIAGNLLNIVLDWLLIFGKWGLPAMGLEGAALATVIANGGSSLLLILFVLKGKQMPFRIRLLGSFGKKLRNYWQVFALGFPSMLEYALWNVGNVVLVSYLNRLDIMSAGIYTLVFSVENVPLLIYMGFANAGLTLVGQQTGANSPRQARRTGVLCLCFSLAVCVGIGIVFRAFPRQILGLFTDDAVTLDAAVPNLVFVTWILFPKAINNVIGLCIRGMGDTRWMFYTQIFGTAFMIFGGYYWILVSGLGLTGIFVTFLLDESIRGIANLTRFLWGKPVAAVK